MMIPWWPVQMLRLLIVLSLAMLMYACVACFSRVLADARPGRTWETSTALVTADAVQRIAALCTLRIPIAQIRVTEMHGRLGGCRLLLTVRGDAVVTTDVARMITSRSDDGAFELSLPTPAVTAVRLDHAATSIYSIERTGLWRLWPGSDIETELTTRAFRDAERELDQAAQTHDWIGAAQEQAEGVLRTLADSLGVRVRFRWVDPYTSHPN
jgi:hypothetical protein